MRWVLLLLCIVATTATAGTLKLNGKFTQGGLVIGQTEPGTVINFEGSRIRTSSKGIFIIGFSRDAKSTATLELIYRDGTKRRETLKVLKRNFKIQAIDGLPKAKGRSVEAKVGHRKGKENKTKTKQNFTSDIRI